MPMSKNSSFKPALMNTIIVIPGKCSVYPVYCEIDSDGRSIYRDEMDPDDLTDYGYLHRNQQKRQWEYPGYGDDD